MRRQLSLRAEVVHRADEATAKMEQPKAIHGNPAREGVVTSDQPRARPRRLAGAPAGSGGKHAGTPAVTTSPRSR